MVHIRPGTSVSGRGVWEDVRHRRDTATEKISTSDSEALVLTPRRNQAAQATSTPAINEA
jgi:hypothetical protein